MPDDRTKTGRPDDTRINIHEPYEVTYWSTKWKISAQDLRDCVASAGVMVKDVEACLRRKGKIY